MTIEEIKTKLKKLHKVTLVVNTTNSSPFSCETTVKGLSQLLLMFCKPQYTYSIKFSDPDILLLDRKLK